MKLTLSENIRLFRKQRKMTQEKLAELLGVSVGAVYKWESGMCQPELALIVEMADFFDISVDALLGYKMKDTRLDSALEQLNGYCRTLDPEALSEAEKMLARYPHSFQVVYVCAKIYLAFGAGSHSREQLNRALELMEQSRMLLPQNKDPRISEGTICGDMATAWFLMNEREKGLEILKQNNAGGFFSNQIGAYLAIFMNRQEEAAPFLTEGLMEGLSIMLTTIVGYVFLFQARRDWDSALAITELGTNFLAGLKPDEMSGSLDKAHAEMLALLAYAQAKSGMPEASRNSLQKAGNIAVRFDSTPDYSLKAMRFADQTDQAIVFDIFGANACESVAHLLKLLGDRDLSEQWREISHYES